MSSKFVNSYWFCLFVCFLPFLSSLIILEYVNYIILLILNIVIQELFRGKHWLTAISDYLECLPIIENTEEKKKQMPIILGQDSLLILQMNLLNLAKTFSERNPNSNSNLCCKNPNNGLLLAMCKSSLITAFTLAQSICGLQLYHYEITLSSLNGETERMVQNNRSTLESELIFSWSTIEQLDQWFMSVIHSDYGLCCVVVNI